MLLGLLFFFVVCVVGWAVAGRLPGTSLAFRLGLAPALGFACLTVLARWSDLLGLASGRGLVLAAAVALASGITLLELRGRALTTTRGVFTPARLAWMTILLAALAIGTWVLGSAPNTLLGVPMLAQDGAPHVEMIQLLRDGGTWTEWYPSGFHSLVAGFLVWFPAVDSAAGASSSAVSLVPAGLLALFGLGVAAFRQLLVGGLGALLASLTISFPYMLHAWSVWPMGVGLVLTLGLWNLAVLYVRSPSWQLALSGALLLAGIVLVHGTELYTAALGLLAILLAHARQFAWRRLLAHLALAALVAPVLAAPYLTTLLSWVGAGGVISMGYEWAGITVQQVAARPFDYMLPFWLATAGTSLLYDAPFRILILGAGIFYSLKRREGRWLTVLLALFLALVLLFSYQPLPTVRDLFAVTMPWGIPYRLVIVPSLLASIVAGSGLFYGGRALWRWLLAQRAFQGRHAPRRQRILKDTALGLAVLTVWLLATVVTQLIARESAWAMGYSPEDAAAMAWLRQNAAPGAVLVNDRSADAGIWAPYKAGVSILQRRAVGELPASSVQQVAGNVTTLSSNPDARAAACALGVRYVYHGVTSVFVTEPRSFPSLDELRASPELREVFSRGEAVVFEAILNC